MFHLRSWFCWGFMSTTERSVNHHSSFWIQLIAHEMQNLLVSETAAFESLNCSCKCLCFFAVESLNISHVHLLIVKDLTNYLMLMFPHQTKSPERAYSLGYLAILPVFWKKLVWIWISVLFVFVDQFENVTCSIESTGSYLTIVIKSLKSCHAVCKTKDFNVFSSVCFRILEYDTENFSSEAAFHYASFYENSVNLFLDWNIRFSNYFVSVF